MGKHRTTLEKVYDEKISPLMKQIIQICKDNDMPICSVFGIGSKEKPMAHICSTSFPTIPVINFMVTLSKCRAPNGQVNFDQFMMAVMRDAKEKGHGSIYLKMLGVDYEPEKKSESER